MDQGKVKFYKKKKERERAGQYPVIRPNKLVVNKGFIAQPELEFFFLVGTMPKIPRSQDGPISTTQVANQDTGITSS